MNKPTRSPHFYTTLSALRHPRQTFAEWRAGTRVDEAIMALAAIAGAIWSGRRLSHTADAADAVPGVTAKRTPKPAPTPQPRITVRFLRYYTDSHGRRWGVPNMAYTVKTDSRGCEVTRWAGPR